VRIALTSTALGEAAEAALVALAIGGDEAAFSELVRRRQSWLRNLLRRLCRDRALADDLAQQALLQAWRSLRNLKSVSAFGGWLRQVAVNVWLNHLRTTAPPPQSLESGVGAASEQAAPHATSEALDLDRALGQLSSDERLCVVLAYHEGMSHSEISGATALPLGTVKSHIKRGAERLRTLLHAYQPDGGQLHVR
jgi:RNA polymerase sigma-70 factor (ECF subfamily)